MGDATDSGHWSLDSIARHIAQELGDETDPAERPTRRDLPRLQSLGRSFERDQPSSLGCLVMLPTPTDEIMADLSTACEEADSSADRTQDHVPRAR
jgi:hypothetical protein